MNKQQYLAASILYKLKCMTPEFGILTLNEIGRHHYGLGQILISNPSLILPILHPIQNLIKDIQIDGKIIKPMFELTKLTFKGYDESDFIYETYQDDTTMIVRTSDNCILGYDLSTLSFFAGKKDVPFSPVQQLTMFQMLIEWHFDIANLIKTGDAIDVTTLSEYPY